MMSIPDTRSPAPPASGNRADRSSFAKRSNSTKSDATTIDFASIDAAAQAAFPPVLVWALPSGKQVRSKLVVSNPRCVDRECANPGPATAGRNNTLSRATRSAIARGIIAPG